MLIACDVDGTIAMNGQWYARWMAREAGLDIPESELASIEFGCDFWQLPAVRALSHEQRVALRALSHAHHKDLDHLANSIPIPGAREALCFLSQHARIIYTTCRPTEAAQLTCDWLARYDFPASGSVYTCDRYHEKFIQARSQAEAKESIVFIDDQVDKLVPVFRALAIHDRAIGLSLIRRIAFVQIGTSEPPHFPPVPFPVLALQSWRRDHLEAFTRGIASGTMALRS